LPTKCVKTKGARHNVANEMYGKKEGRKQTELETKRIKNKGGSKETN